MSTVIKRWLNKCGAELLNKNFKPNTQNLTN